MRVGGGGSVRSAVVTVLALVLTTAAVPGRAAPPAAVPAAGSSTGGVGVGDDYFPEDGNGGIDVLHYDVRVRYDFRRRSLVGTTALTVRATQDLSRFNLDLLLGVRSVAVDGRPARFTKPNRHELQVTPVRPVAEGARFRVVVRYAGRPSAVGWRGEHPWTASRREVVTMGQPQIAAWWFPANDHPRDRARIDVRVTTNRKLQVVANGHRVGRRVRGRVATTHWRSPEPMAPYLAFFAAGDFRVERGSTRGIRWLAAVSRQLSPHRQRTSMQRLRQSGRITAWLQREVGRYPFSSTGGLVTGLDVDFALENQTRPTYPWLGLGRGDRDLVVHELAHQWFGNAMTLRRWRDIWLNEGFATFYEWRYAEYRREGSTRDRLRRVHRRLADDPWFWRVRVDDPGPARIFDDAVYVRGAMTLAALRERIGRGAFRTLVREWYAANRGRTVTTGALVSLAERVSGQDLGDFFQVWLRDPRPPQRTAANGLR